VDQESAMNSSTASLMTLYRSAPLRGNSFHLKVTPFSLKVMSRLLAMATRWVFAREVRQHRLGPAERPLGVDDPFGLA